MVCQNPTGRFFILLRMTQVTMFKNAKDPGDPKLVNVDRIVEGIQHGQWQSMIDKLNSIEPDSPEQKKFKNTSLPAICWQGEFTYRNDKGCAQHSGLVCLDFDHIPVEEMEHQKELIINSEHTHILFKSPRGSGYKAIVKIPADIENHKAYVMALGTKVKNLYYDHFDDISRLCFVSYDPEIYYNKDSKIWDGKGIIKKVTAKTLDTAYIPSDIRQTFENLITWAEKTSRYEDDNKHKHLVKVLGACNRYGIPKEDAIKLTYERYKDTKNVEPVKYEDYENRADSTYRLYQHQHGTETFDTPAAEFEIGDPDATINQFPIEVFPVHLQHYILDLNQSLNYSKDFLSTTILSAMATLNGNKYKLRVKDNWISPTIFWFAIVGDPGTMKSHPVSTILQPIKEIDKLSKLSHDIEYDKWEQKQIELKSKKQQPEESSKRPIFKQIMISDITLEALHEVSSFNQRGLMYYRDELKAFINNMNVYRKGSDGEFWLESFNNGSYIVNRVSSRPRLIDNTNINIIGTIQPDTLSSMAKDMSDNGLIDRFLFTGAERNIYGFTTQKPDGRFADYWRNCLNMANGHFRYEQRSDTVIIDLTDTALERFVEIDHIICEWQRSEDISNEMKGYLSKAKTYIPRFALLMALFDMIFDGIELHAVGVEHINKAFQIMRYFLKSGNDIFNESKTTSEMRDITQANKGLGKRDKIKKLIAEGFSQTKIAKELKVSRQYISKILSQK